jgi:hypothetical protein
LVEKSHSVLFGKIRAVLNASGLPHTLWGEAANYVIYTQNRTGCTVHDGLTPYEMLHGDRPNIGHLRAWGCVGVVYKDKTKRPGRFDNHGELMLMMGYVIHGYGYRMLDLKNGIIVEARDGNVKFYEQHTVKEDYVRTLLHQKYTLRQTPDVHATIPYLHWWS